MQGANPPDAHPAGLTANSEDRCEPEITIGLSAKSIYPAFEAISLTPISQYSSTVGNAETGGARSTAKVTAGARVSLLLSTNASTEREASFELEFDSVTPGRSARSGHVL